MRVVVLVLAVLVAGCAGASDEGTQEAEPAEEPASEGEQMAEVYIVATDMSYRPQSVWKFYPEEAHAPADETFNLTFKSAGGNSYAHTLVIDELDVRLEAPAEFESDSVLLEAPAGTYTYYCDVENHRQLGMEGTLVIE